MSETKYDIPGVERIQQMLRTWNHLQWHAYIADLYTGLATRDKEIEELKEIGVEEI